MTWFLYFCRARLCHGDCKVESLIGQRAYSQLENESDDRLVTELVVFPWGLRRTSKLRPQDTPCHGNFMSTGGNSSVLVRDSCDFPDG